MDFLFFQMFNLIIQFTNDRKPLKNLNAVYVTDPDVIAECMARRKKLHAVRI